MNIWLSVSYLLLVVMLLLITISVKNRWFIKSLAIFGVLFYSLVINNAVSSFAGWPTAEKMPEAEFHWAVIISA